MKKKKVFITNILGITASLMTLIGVVFHDTQADHATTVAINKVNALPTVNGSDEVKLKITQPHTHSHADPGAVDGIKNVSSDGYAALPRNDRKRSFKNINLRRSHFWDFVTEGLGF